MFAKNFLKQELYKNISDSYSNEKPGTNNYCLGCRIKIFDNNEKLTYHNGWWHGTNSVFGHLLKTNDTIIGLSLIHS